MPPIDDTPALKDYVILSGTANPKLAKEIAKILKKDLHEPVSIFSDGEIRVRIPPNLRRRHVFIIQPTSPPVNDHIMELLLMIDAARRSSASEINVVMPYFGYARQDRKEMPHVPVSASVVANMIEHVGANRIVTIDIHAEQEQGFAKLPWDNLYGSYSLLPAIKARNLSNLVVASPDKGGMTRATGYARLLGASGVALVYKERDIAVNNKSDALDMIGEVKGKDVLLVDDMLDTGGTIVSAANFIKKRGAKTVRVVITHGLFTGIALKNINRSEIDEVITTDTIMQLPSVVKQKRITIVSVAPLLSEAIRRIRSGESISRDLIL